MEICISLRFLHSTWSGMMLYEDRLLKTYIINPRATTEKQRVV